MAEIRGKTVVLRTLEREHCRQLWQGYEPALPQTAEAIHIGLSVEGADRWFEEMQAKQGREHVYLGVFHRDGRLLGDIQLANIDWRNRTATLGGGLARQADRGQGWGTDAALAILRYGFRELGLERIEAETAETNEAAQHVLARLGFRPEGRRRKALARDGQRWDSLIYGLLREEFSETP